MTIRPGDALQVALEAYSNGDNRVAFITLIGVINGLCEGNEKLTREINGLAKIFKPIIPLYGKIGNKK